MKSFSDPTWDELVRTDRKTLGITVRPDRTILVRAPLTASEEQILAKLRLRRRWIWRQQSFFLKFEPRPTERRYISGESHLYMGRQYRLKVVEGIERGVNIRAGYLEVSMPNPSPEAAKELLWDWYWSRAKVQFESTLRMVRKKFYRPIPAEPIIEIRHFAKRWGSCHPDGRIALNIDLIRAPRACLEYVIAHEICHLLVPNHSRQFFALLETIMPDWTARKERLEVMLARPLVMSGKASCAYVQQSSSS